LPSFVVLNRDHAAFVKLREMLTAHKDLAKRLDEMEGKYDSQFKVVFDAIRQLMAVPEKKMKEIKGFQKGKTGE
jgi:hypothetical protein